MKLEEFRLESHKERELIMMALTYYSSHRSDDIDLLKLRDALNSLELRISRTECQPGGCEICNPDYGDLHDIR